MSNLFVAFMTLPRPGYGDPARSAFRRPASSIASPGARAVIRTSVQSG